MRALYKLSRDLQGALPAHAWYRISRLGRLKAAAIATSNLQPFISCAQTTEKTERERRAAD